MGCTNNPETYDNDYPEYEGRHQKDDEEENEDNEKFKDFEEVGSK